ncbi:cytochrome c oxidase subunit 3 [Acidihalobacter ferrooxydans]|uniref:Heme-copper oxidase subunit III family profile domain-containing protein n=1 Tax=Acidihalobacter ferrooxydans TaxID=1765967 RepID=A0A1P8UF03_9GAMM|nr:cytochrome c oxidase subunit 3 [Acidihalobacter ferrooxydans]APZ42344.1 hypothetical protein BW247_03940 [Acidihalobacter ferrooxydans]
MSTHHNPAVQNDDAMWQYEDHPHDVIGTRTLGFWLYMMSDLMIFAALFATCGIYADGMHSAGSFQPGQVIDPNLALWSSGLIFASVLAYGYAMVALKKASRSGVLLGLGIAFLLGLAFLGMEWHEFSGLAHMGAIPQKSGFLSDFWVIVLTHGVHVMFGLLWMLTMLVQVAREGFTENVVYRLLNLKIFWLFQAVIWVCVFTLVYLMGSTSIATL